jgi:hypothetical protein
MAVEWIVVAAALAVFTLFPVGGMVLAWGCYAWRSRHPYPIPHRLPRVAVILPLRGADPSLEACLSGVLAQDYPAYTVHIVVDGAEDPAQAVVTSVLKRGHGPQVGVYVDVRNERNERCGLKLSAQRQALLQLDDAVEVVAFLDADSIPAADWLRVMVAPFADPRVGAASGVRWSMPGDHGWGTLTRYVFNALSFPQMYLYRIPWGGSLAVRKRLLHEAGLLDYWRRCLCEDTSAYGPIRASGLRLAFVPAATQLNSEVTDLAGAYYFILRQLICVRLHHVYWPRLLAANLATMLAFLACCLLAVVGVVGAGLALFGVATQLWQLTALAIIPLVYFAGAAAMLLIGERLVRRVVAAPPQRIGFARLACGISLGLYQTTHAMFATLLTRAIDWRGITYDIQGRDRVYMRAYRPYRGAGAEPVATHSVL